MSRFQVMVVGVILLCLAVVALIWHGVRRWFYPIPGQMPDHVTDSVESVLSRLEKVLEIRAPELLGDLVAGISELEIREIEARHGFRLSDDMRALYRWRNGSTRENPVELVPGHRFVPLEEAAEKRDGTKRLLSQAGGIAWLATQIFAGHRLGWLVIFDDGCGDGYFFDPGRRRRSGSIFYQFAQDSRYRFFPSVANLVMGISDCYEEQVFRQGRRRLREEAIERAEVIWERYSAIWIGR